MTSRRTRLLAIVLLWGCAGAADSRSEMQTLVDNVADLTFGQGYWAGARVPKPTACLRPTLPYSMRDTLAPLRVHFGDHENVESMREFVRGGSLAWSELFALLGTMPTDGGSGDGAELDVYVSENHQTDCVATDASPMPSNSLGVDGVLGADGLHSSWSSTDANLASERGQSTSMHVGYEPSVFRDELDRMATFGVVEPQAIHEDAYYVGYCAVVYLWLHALEPAEADDVVAAMSTQLAYRDVVPEPAQKTRTTLYADGAMGRFLHAISLRHDRGTGRFLLEAFLLSRQHSGGPDFFHATPTTWTALERMLSLAHDSLENELRVHHVRLGEEVARTDAAEPLRANYQTNAIEVSGYDVRHFSRDRAHTHLDVWLRGEYLARWGLAVIALDAHGNTLQMLQAPIRNEPAAYLPVPLTPNVVSIAVVVSQLGEAPNREVSDYWRYRYTNLTVADGDIRAALRTPPPYIPELQRAYTTSNRVAAARVTLRGR